MFNSDLAAVSEFQCEYQQFNKHGTLRRILSLWYDAM